LTNTNKSATAAKAKNFYELNTPLVDFRVVRSKAILVVIEQQVVRGIEK
jgi:hypothetical protein